MQESWCYFCSARYVQMGFEKINIFRSESDRETEVVVSFEAALRSPFQPLFDIDKGFIGSKISCSNRFYFAHIWKWGKPCCSLAFDKNVSIRETSLASEGVMEEQDETQS